MKKKITLLFAMFAALVTTATADNVISAEPLNIATDGTADLTINLQNDADIRGIQFTLTLPAGVTVVGDPEAAIKYVDENNQEQSQPLTNGVVVSTAERTSSGWTVVGNMASSTETSSIYKFVLISFSGESLAAGSGAVMKITFQADASINPATFDNGVAFSDIHFATVSGESITDVEQTTDPSVDLIVTEYAKGDANGDGDIDTADAVAIVNFVVGKPNTKWVESAADADGDNEIDTADAVHIVNFVVGKITSLSRDLDRSSEWNLPEPD